MMKTKKDKIIKMISKIKSIYKDTLNYEKKYSSRLKKVHPQYKKSAKNLIDYISLRKHDIHLLQGELGDLGLSRLGRCEHHVHGSLLSTLDTLRNFHKVGNIDTFKPSISIKRGKKFIATNTKNLLGYKSKGRRARIMVTLPSEASENYKLVYGLLSSGMNSARINCAHDGPEVWAEMIKNIKKANKSLGKNCRIIMDLGGPKLRTGPMVPGPKIEHIQSERDIFGNILRPGSAWLINSPISIKESGSSFIPVSGDISKIQVNDKIIFQDAQNKNSTLIVKRKLRNALFVQSLDSVYFIPGLKLILDSAERQLSLTVNDLPALEQLIFLKMDDQLILHKDQKPGEPAKFDSDGKLLQIAHISCSFPEIFKFIKKGEPIFFDDGKIEGIIQSVSAKSAKIRIVTTKKKISKLGQDKGINLPKSKISLNSLSVKDKTDLKFISKNADVVALSFVNNAKDVIHLLKEIKKIKSKLGIIIKIETRQGLKNLPHILLAAMRNYPVGIMIARGDLAIECGWQDMAKIQEEILLFSGSAHVPVIWATQVLENVAKKGMPSRAEITDAAMSQRAECVMLNKGPFINEAVHMLDDILKSMEPYRSKMSPMLPVLRKNDFNNI